MTTVNGKSLILVVGGITISNRLVNVGTPGHIDHNRNEYIDRHVYEKFAPIPEINKPYYRQTKGRRRSY